MNKTISPSLICMDLCRLAEETASLETLGCRMLHVDVIDGRFSPDMPLGIDTVRQLRKTTRLIFDAHLMAVDNAPYVDLLLQAGVDRLCFHTEYESRPAILLRRIRAAGVKAGVAISPETPLSQLEYLLPLCDFVLVMRIDPGYAHLAGQAVYPFTDQKIVQLRERYPALEIEVDGRVGFDEIQPLARLGANTFVSGTKGLFFSGGTREENWKRLIALTKEDV